MFWENIKEAITSISSNKMRSLLTMLGIIIGISSVIIITTIGGSIQSTLTATMNSLGGNMVQAYVEARYPENDEDWATWEQPDMTDSDYVTQDMIDGLIEKYPDEVTGVAAQNYLGSGTIKDDADSKNYANVNIDGITPEYLEYMKLEMHAGRNLTKADNQGKKRVCLIADTMAERYFAGKDPIGETLSVATSDGGIFDFVVVGVYVYNQALFGKVDTSIPEKDRVTELMIPLQTCFKLQGTDRTGYDYFNLMIDPLADVNQATTDVLSYFDEMYANNKNSDREFKKSKTKKKVDVKKIVIVVIIVAACLAAFLARKVYTRNYYTQEYTAGTKGIKGNVNVSKFTDVSEDFAIGANSNGYAVFKNPSKAFKTFEKMYADDIQSLKDEFGLKDFNKKTYHDYMTYGWQSNVGTDEEKQNKKFISSFLDIYENSEWR